MGTDNPPPQDMPVRDRMALVWHVGRADLPGLPYTPAEAVSAMMLYASRLVTQPGGPRVGDLAGIADMVRFLVPGRDILALSLDEYERAVKKHPGMTLECDGHTDASRLFALVEEIGEVAACLTYDNVAETGHGSDLESEAIQVSALALAWATRYLGLGKPEGRA